jgi:hypothetical protein
MAESTNKGLTNLNVVDVPKFTVAENSAESVFINEKYLNVVKSTINKTLPVYQSFGSAESYAIIPGNADLNVPLVPQLDDIQSVDPEEYYENGIAKAKVTIRIRNSSGRQLKGIDARLEIPAASGGL